MALFSSSSVLLFQWNLPLRYSWYASAFRVESLVSRFFPLRTNATEVRPKCRSRFAPQSCLRLRLAYRTFHPKVLRHSSRPPILLQCLEHHRVSPASLSGLHAHSSRALPSVDQYQRPGSENLRFEPSSEAEAIGTGCALLPPRYRH